MQHLKLYEATYRGKMSGESVKTKVLAASIQDAEKEAQNLIQSFGNEEQQLFKLVAISEFSKNSDIKPMGIVRTMDDLGRIVIPKEVRHSVGIKEGDAIDITFNGRTIMLNPVCDDPLDRVEVAISKLTGCSILKQDLQKRIAEYKRKERTEK